MERSVLFWALSLVAFAGVADVSVTDVAVSQNWPWDSKVKVSFTISDGGAGGTYDVSALKILKDGLSRAVDINAFPFAIEGDTASLPAGRHSLVWNPARSSPFAEDAALIEDVRFAVEVTAAAAKRYLVIDLSGGPDAVSYPVSTLDAPPAGGWTTDYKTTKLVLRRIKAGTFVSGSPETQPERSDYEALRTITLTNDYYIGVFEVTQKQWGLVTGLTPDSERNASDAPAGTCPAYKISWGDVRGADLGTNWPYHAGVDASSFMGKLAAKTDLSGIVPSDRIFDLPTRAQWEYACRAGTDTAWNNGFGINCYTNNNADAVDDNLSRLAWYRVNAGYKYHEVGTKLPNAWGLYDMHGNVAEWVRDVVIGNFPDNAIEPRGSDFASNGQGGCGYRGRKGGAYDGSHNGGSLASHSIGLYTSSRTGRNESTSNPTTLYSYVGFRLALVYELGSKD